MGESRSICAGGPCLLSISARPHPSAAVSFHNSPDDVGQLVKVQDVGGVGAIDLGAGPGGGGGAAGGLRERESEGSRLRR